MIGINTVVTQTNGSIVIYELAKSSFRESTARVQRTATLDGGVVLNHNGFSNGDSTFRILARLSEADSDIVWDLYALGTNVYLSCPEGYFLGAMKSLNIDNGDMVLTFLVKEKKSA